MDSSEDFDSQASDFELIPEKPEIASVRKYLSQPKDLLDKILFCSYKPVSLFPKSFSTIPDFVKPDSAQTDSNNMNLIYESAFEHQKLKKNVLGFLLGNHLTSKVQAKKNLPTIKQYYQNQTPCYLKYTPNGKSEYLATYILDSKRILKRKSFSKPPSSYSRNQSKPLGYSSNLRGSLIQFNSNFECGNLFSVYKKQIYQYDLVLQNDINTRGNNQWFFFSVKNAPKNTIIKFNIVNLTKKHSLFDYGMKPYVFSQCRFQKRNIGWVRQGLKLQYAQNQRMKRQRSQKPFYQLTFQYKFNYDGDVVYFSQSIPYGANDLTNFITSHIKEKRNSKLMKLKYLGNTIGNQQLDIIEITNEQFRQNKKAVWIIARQHSGQTTSSFMIEGIINKLLQQTQESINLLNNYVFKIVPMVNIDGVVHGNSRAELSGSDPNRKWASPHQLRNPIIYSLKKAILKDKQNIQMFLDLHSHSRKLGTFFYGNSFKDSKISTRKYPMMVSKEDERFSYQSCRFSPCNPSSARYVLFQALKIPLVYTVQSSFFGFQKNDHKITQYLPRDYRQMGVTLISTFWKYSVQKYKKLTLSGNLITNDDQEQQELENERLKQQGLDDLEGSDSDPSGDEFEQKELQSIMPTLFGAKKKKKKQKEKKRKKPKKKKQEQTHKKQQVPVVNKVKKNDKQSHYRIYFSGRNSFIEKKIYKQINKIKKEMKEFGVQANIQQNSVLKGCQNTRSTLLIEKRNSLYVMGYKMQQELNIFGNNVGIQAQIARNFTLNKEQMRQSIPRRSFKLTSRGPSVLQTKQNNFLNRADCHQFSTTAHNFLQRR